MITICESIENIEKIIAATKIRQNEVYCLSSQCVMQKTDDGVLLYHTLTCALLLLDEHEAALLNALPGQIPEGLETLATGRFLVPVEADEPTYCEQLRRILAMTQKKEDAITSYTIFTTTDCNARCFYCFELGKSRIPMTDSTAKKIGEYITAHCKGKPVRLHWFGGEPLMGMNAIDIILAELKKNNISYSSIMTSNGYLFDEELVGKAKDEWKLKRIQITLDGTEEIYNRRKAYIYCEGSAYRRVLKNIGLLLDAGIHVQIRLNLDMNNQDELYKLVNELADTFGARENLSVYNYIIFEKTGENRSAEQRKELYQASAALTEHIRRCGLAKAEGVPRDFKLNCDMADNDACVTVTPEGRLGKCEHFSETEEMWGSIWSEEKDEAVIASWKERYPALPECKSCFCYPNWKTR